MQVPPMNDGKDNSKETVNTVDTVETVKPMRTQAIVCIGEYPIKTLLKQPNLNRDVLPIFIEKSSTDIYKWIPNSFETRFVLGFEDEKIDTHFWYHVLPTITKNESLMENLKKYSVKTAIIFASIWDGVGSASLPTLISKFKAAGIDSLSIALLPSQIQPTDAHFNAYGSLQLSSATDGATVLLIDRDNLENYEGVDRKGAMIKGNLVSNYLLDLFESKDLLVEEISELSRSFNVKFFTPLVVAGASYNIYGSLENMLNAALLKPLLTFDLSSASLLYVLFRMSKQLAEKLSRTKLELAVTNWFKEKTSLQSIHVTEPIYTDELNDRIDAVLFIGGFDSTQMFAEFEAKVKSLKAKAVERGFITEDWQTVVKVEPEPEIKTVELPPPPPPPIIDMPILEPIVEAAPVNVEQTIVESVPKIVEQPSIESDKINQEPQAQPKKRIRKKKQKKNLAEPES
jgi:hypothetical protein